MDGKVRQSLPPRADHRPLNDLYAFALCLKSTRICIHERHDHTTCFIICTKPPMHIMIRIFLTGLERPEFALELRKVVWSLSRQRLISYLSFGLGCSLYFHLQAGHVTGNSNTTCSYPSFDSVSKPSLPSRSIVTRPRLQLYVA